MSNPPIISSESQYDPTLSMAELEELLDLLAKTKDRKSDAVLALFGGLAVDDDQQSVEG